MQSPKRLKITDVNPHLICVLCGGYYIDATTIIECLHSFCKSCIVKYLEKNKYCPICDVQVHKYFPLLNIRRDKTLQDIVYKLVPSLFQNEMRRRSEFYSLHPDAKLPSDPELRGEVCEQSTILLPDESISICLEYQSSGQTDLQAGKRYLHCPAAVSISHLVKLLRGKFSLSPSHQVKIYYKDELLPESLSLMDVAYIFQWKRKTPIHFTYQILEKQKRVLVSPGKRAAGHEWKEVQLQITENGVMHFRNIPPVATSKPEESSAPQREKKEEPPKENCVATDSKPSSAPVASTPPVKITTTANSTHSTESKTTTSITTVEPVLSVSKVSKEVATTMKKASIVEVNNLSISRVSPSGLAKEKRETLNRIVSKLCPNERVIGNTSVTIRPVSSPKVATSGASKALSSPTTTTTSAPVLPLPSPQTPPIPSTSSITNSREASPKPSLQKKSLQHFKYKTLMSPTKPWNPTIDRNTLLGMKQQSADICSKEPRFFKMRNNVPRYLGNPASGVKPMYQISGDGHDSPPKQRVVKSDAKPLGSSPPMPRSPTKMPPPFTPGSPRRSPNPYVGPNTFPRIPSPAHAGSFLASNPYSQFLYGFPFPSSPAESVALIRSMCTSPGAYHPSLPPSISMLYPHVANNQTPPPLPPPTVQRIPPSKGDSQKPSEKKPEEPKPPIPPAPPQAPPQAPLKEEVKKIEEKKDIVNNSNVDSENNNQSQPIPQDISKDVTINNNVTKESPAQQPKENVAPENPTT